MGFIGGVVRFLVLLLAISYLVCFLTDYLFWPTYLTGFMSLFVAVMVRSNTHVNAVSNAKMTTKTDPVTWLLRLLLVLLLVPSYVIAQYLPRETILSLYFDIIAELLLPRIVTVYIFKNDRENELKRRTVAVTLWCCLVLLQFALLQAVSYLRGMWSRKRLENVISLCYRTSFFDAFSAYQGLHKRNCHTRPRPGHCSAGHTRRSELLVVESSHQVCRKSLRRESPIWGSKSLSPQWLRVGFSHSLPESRN